MFLVLAMNATRMDGNPHLNFGWQNAMEMPALYIGMYLSNRIGRRFTQVGSFALFCFVSLPILAVVRETEYSFVVACLTVTLRLVHSVNFFAMQLQAIEIFPTCLRTSGMAILVIASNLFALLTPWAVYLVRKKL